MAMRKLDTNEWDSYFRKFSKDLIDQGRVGYAEIRVFSPEIGAQTQANWLPLAGITYDRKDNLLEITVNGLDHLIYKPREIFVDETVEGVLTSMQVVHPDGTTEVIEVR